jgi:hypothetical protein
LLCTALHTKRAKKESESAMIRGALSKVMWVGKATVFLVGLAVILALVFGVAFTALGANGQNFILGSLNNRATAITKLTGTVGGPALRVSNPTADDGSTALDLEVASGMAPMNVNSSTKVTTLNADLLDGKNSTAFVQGDGKITHFGPVNVNAGPSDTPLRNLATVGPFTFRGQCNDNSLKATQLYFQFTGVTSWAVQSSGEDRSMTQDGSSTNLSIRTLVRTEGNSASATASGYAHNLSAGKVIFFELYQYRKVDSFGNESCTFGGYVVE